MLQAKYPPGTFTGKAQKASMTALEAKYRAELDPEGRLTDAEWAVRWPHAKKTHYQRLAMLSEQKRARS